jgi:hypothetical protein
VKTAALALIVVCGAMLVTAAVVPTYAAEPITEDVPVAGGLAAVAALAEVTPVPDRARFAAEVARVIYSSPATGPYSNEPIRRRIEAFFAEARQRASGSPEETVVPVPLSAALWSQSVFHRQVDRRDLIGAIFADRSAGLLCYGLAALDDDTLRFLVDHASLLGRLAERAAATFAAFGQSLRVRDGRIVPPGGAAAQALWEAAVGEKLDRPDRFIQVLFENDRGRLAYLYDVLSRLDPPALAFALGSSIGDPEERVTRFKRLVALAKRAFVEWDVTTAPFVRPPNALAAFFERIRFETDGKLAGPTTPAFWQRAFDDSGVPDPPAQAGAKTIDAAWLSELVLGQTSRERERRLEGFSFAQRVFGSRVLEAGGTGQAGQAATETDDAIKTVRSFAQFPVLMLTLERMGTRAPSVYVAAGQQAEKLTELDQTRGSQALAQFQGAVALLSRMVRVHSIDAATGELLARDLFDARLTDGRFTGAIAAWMNDRLRPALAVPPANATLDEVLLAAASGPRATGAAKNVDWEGQRYQVDISGAEFQRLTRVREKQAGPSFELILGVAAIARRLGEPSLTLANVQDAAAKLTAAATELATSSRAGAEKHEIATIRDAAQTLVGIKRANDVSDARKPGAQLTAVSDVMLGEALLSLAYALDLGDPEGTVLIAGDPAGRHDFGYGLPGRDPRVKAMWGIAITETRNGPSHLVGSALALDVAMAPLALRRINNDRVPEAPMLNLIQRDGFAATVALMDPRALTDSDRDAIAADIDRGRRRVIALASRAAEDADTIAREAGLDGWRRRALEWTVRNEPGRISALFTMAEFLVLGGGMPADFNPWGTFALRTRGCFCTALAAPGRWQSWFGLSQAGLPAGVVSDLPLYVAVVLHNLNLPAVLAKPVLAAATQDFVDGVNPTDGNDWLTLARAAQAIDAERFEDYVAAATAEGPLLPDLSGK